MSPRSFLEIFPLAIVESILDEFCHHTRLSPCQTCLSLNCSCDAACECIHPSRKPPITAWVRALASLNRTCRRLNELTTARLYRDPTAARHSPTLLTRTLFARPDLARLVRFLRVGGESSGYYGDVISEEVADYVVNKVIARRQACGLEAQSREDCRAQVGRLGHCATLDVMTSLCPNIEAIDGDDILTDDPLVPLLCERGVEDSSPLPFQTDVFWTPGELAFPKLKMINLSHADTEYGFPMSTFQGLLGCAALSVQALRLCQLWSCDIVRVPTWMTMQRTVRATARLDMVTHIIVVDGVLNFQDLLNLVELCPNVEYFKYTCGGPVVALDCEQFGPQHAVDAALALQGGGQGWKRLKDISLGLWADDFKELWDEDEVPVAERMFAERGIKFTCEI
ncbi:hypothetical protein QBC37DRAFT_447568 [Rhypophila decipiens]|uniref:Uncharacterized protein n=1 Tax=Rhypophila decipiens TaxID=261697 RepID=A0AAN7B7B8_9PEZI|nr:hypothetical protein QBC37DRAFT_447568 [Rhypophila decipiens]